MRSFLNKIETNPELQIPLTFKENPKQKSFILGLIIFIIISISILILLNYDPSNPNAEKDLTELHERYTKGEKLDKKDFALYCLLLEKVWKKHLLSCYCPDGVINPTNGIDWTNPPDSPEKLGSEWMEITDGRAKEKSLRREFVNRNTKEKIGYDIGFGLEKYIQENHWHRYNPDSESERDRYLDMCGEKVGKSSPKSHIKIRNLIHEKRNTGNN
jgi:hypothetical protein